MQKTCAVITLLLLVNLTAFAQHPILNLTEPEQQKDFLKYLNLTISLLEDKSMKATMNGYKLDRLSDSNKQEIANKIVKDTGYFKKLNDYFVFLKTMNDKYKISRFTHEEWKEVAQFGAQHGIYFIQAMERFRKPKDTLSGIPNFFPFIPLIKDSSKINSRGF